MRIATYTFEGKTGIGVLLGDRLVPLPAYTDMLSFICAGPQAWQTAAIADRGAEAITLEQVRLQAPLNNPGKVIAIGLNYMDHCREQNVEPPKQPLVFAKFPSSIIGPSDEITWDPRRTSQVDFEVELGVVIGREARRVKRTEALSFVFGYTVLNDVSARDLQFGDGQWVRGKSLDTFCPIGPAIVTADEIPSPQSLTMSCSVNGVVLQNSTTAEMIFDVSELISYLSHYITLYPGDILATGTPFGVGVFRNPQVFLKDGDLVTAEIEFIGKLENRCREQLFS